MSEYIPSIRLRAGSTSAAADFITRVDAALTLDHLTRRFSEALGLHAASHACYEIRSESRTYLFGEAGWGGPIVRPPVMPQLCFPITGWDEKSYEVEIRLFSMLETKSERANLHTMAVLYVSRGIALLDAQDNLTAPDLTQTELFCLDQRRGGWCDLDIADALGRSVQAVQIHIQRAMQKQLA